MIWLDSYIEENIGRYIVKSLDLKGTALAYINIDGLLDKIMDDGLGYISKRICKVSYFPL